METIIYQVLFCIATAFGTFWYRRAKRLEQMLKDLQERELNKQTNSLNKSNFGLSYMNRNSSEKNINDDMLNKDIYRNNTSNQN
jgi:hypothetical protein